ncbi:MAG TPA: winged helix-turn-helix domain-containing protein [Nitrososphaerales archaeon]|nr:winged helix-turn-helix domain-containing protein [Nitrososphaerales archaeon]
MLELEKLMSSYGRTKVLTVMLETGELNISEIMRRSGLSHGATAKHLEFLTKSGIITEKRFNRIRIFRLDQSSPFTGALARFYSDWKEAGGAEPQAYN